MIFKANEAVGGLKHASMGWQRIILKRPVESLLPRFLPTLKNIGIDAGAAQDASGQIRRCAICGYALARVTLDNGWTMDVCSAMPVLKFNHPLLNRWVKDMPSDKLPEPAAKQYTSVADGVEA